MLGCMIVVDFVLQETSKPCLRVATPFYIPTSNVFMILFLHILDSIWCSHYFFIVTILTGEFKFVSLMANYIENLFMCLFAIYLFS